MCLSANLDFYTGDFVGMVIGIHGCEISTFKWTHCESERGCFERERQARKCAFLVVALKEIGFTYSREMDVVVRQDLWDTSVFSLARRYRKQCPETVNSIQKLNSCPN